MKWTIGPCLFEVTFAAVSCFAARFGAARGIGWFSTEKQKALGNVQNHHILHL
ncbi:MULTISPECIES: hypothetical protein [unclassified Leisingera]|uniref:hypothetical protein n=1 Tax=unclassified Leisingera TaxID=2614906 RepID=UPI00187C5A34|nr:MULTISPECIES: hypothetical protein [unclassified Leisingera]